MPLAKVAGRVPHVACAAGDLRCGFLVLGFLL